MRESLSSPTLRSGNVLALLNTLYTSGFAMASPSTPVLPGRTMHTLYAISFIVCMCNCIADWIHIWATLQGYVTSFPLETWLAVALVVTGVSGSMLCWLLLVLCMENAFAHRLDITPYRSGFALIAESFFDWIQAFNNFRVVFLVMVLHDLPFTILNFFFIVPCRCAGPTVYPWSLLFSSSTIIISLFWRITMLHFSYRRMLCPLKKTTAIAVHRMPTPSEHLAMSIDTSGGGRIDEYDECWPVRWSRLHVYGKDPEDEVLKNKLLGHGSFFFRTDHLPSVLSLPIISHLATFSLVVANFLYRMVQLIVCTILSCLAYTFMILTLCIPYCYHYTCRRNSFYHRHKCARSFIRYTSYTFHYIIFISSLLLSIALIAINMTLISSVHVIGSHNIPPEIDRVCVTIVPSYQEIHVTVQPEPLFFSTTLPELVNSKFIPYDNRSATVCKPVYEDGGLGFGLKRRDAGPWQARRLVNGELLAVTTKVVVKNDGPEDGRLELYHDFAILRPQRGLDLPVCKRINETAWRLYIDHQPLPFPYFIACKQTWSYSSKELIDCLGPNEATTTIPRPPDGWIRRYDHQRRHKMATRIL